MKYIPLLILLALTSCLPYTQVDLSAEAKAEEQDTRTLKKDRKEFGAFFYPDSDSIEVIEDPYLEAVLIAGKKTALRYYDAGLAVTYFWSYVVTSESSGIVMLNLRPAYIADTSWRFNDAIIKGYRDNDTDIGDIDYRCWVGRCHFIEKISIEFSEDMLNHDYDVFEIRLYSDQVYHDIIIPVESLSKFMEDIESLITDKDGLTKA